MYVENGHKYCVLQSEREREREREQPACQTVVTKDLLARRERK